MVTLTEATAGRPTDNLSGFAMRPSRQMGQQKHVIIIGNGIAGITAARHIRKRSDHRITVISAETDHFFSRTSLMYIYMGHMKYEHTKPYEDWFWEKNRIGLKRAYVSKAAWDTFQQLKSTKPKLAA